MKRVTKVLSPSVIHTHHIVGTERVRVKSHFVSKQQPFIYVYPSIVGQEFKDLERNDKTRKV